MENIKSNEACKSMHENCQSKSWELCAAGELLPYSDFSALRGASTVITIRRGILVPGLRSRLQLVGQGCCCAVVFQGLWQEPVTCCYDLMVLCHHLVRRFFPSFAHYELLHLQRSRSARQLLLRAGPIEPCCAGHGPFPPIDES